MFEGNAMLERNLHKAENSLAHINGFKDLLNDVEFQITSAKALTLSELMKEGLSLMS